MLSDANPYIKGYEPSRDDPDDALLKPCRYPHVTCGLQMLFGAQATHGQRT
jgi:hypothetical protein